MKQRMGYPGRPTETETNQRAPLTGSYGSRSTAPLRIGKPLSSEADHHAADMTADMEAQNDELIDDLHQKVLGLKQIASGMRDEVRESNVILDHMVCATFKHRLDVRFLGYRNDNRRGIAHRDRPQVAKTCQLSRTSCAITPTHCVQTGRHIWLMMLFFVGFIFLLYLLFGKRR